MKLSDLVAYKLALDELDTRSVARQVDIGLSKVTHLVESQPFQIGNFQQKLNKCYNDIDTSLSSYEQEFKNLKAEVKKAIEVAEKPWFQESYRLYEESRWLRDELDQQDEYHYNSFGNRVRGPDLERQTQKEEFVKHVLHYKPSLDAESELMLRSRLKSYTDWQHPGLVIHPGTEVFLKDMVSFDPLYIVDHGRALLTPAVQQFPEDYQRRLRLYSIKEIEDRDILEKIPNGQFGLCFVYNFFEYKPFEVIRRYLAEIYQKLKPGGTLIMTFNDCDNDKAIKLVEQHCACYTPGSLVLGLAENIGYDINFKWNNRGPSTWVEMSKPGELTTMRGGQTLAKIIHKSVAKSK